VIAAWRRFQLQTLDGTIARAKTWRDLVLRRKTGQPVCSGCRAGSALDRVWDLVKQPASSSRRRGAGEANRKKRNAGPRIATRFQLEIQASVSLPK
jgi:hypothetical protein